MPYELLGDSGSALRWLSVWRGADHLRASLGLTWLGLCELAGLQAGVAERYGLQGASAPPAPDNAEGQALWTALEAQVARAATARGTQDQPGLSGRDQEG